jgi:hypothetical protein
MGVTVAAVVRARTAPASTESTSQCAPRPCINADGYTMMVQGVQRQTHLVRLEVSFQVRGQTKMHAVPGDFSLLESGRTYRPYFDVGAGCPAWSRTQIPDGGHLGPKVLCFAPPDPHGRLTLKWDPDLGISEYFSSGYGLVLS